MRARGVVPDEERLAVSLGLLHERDGTVDDLVKRPHVVFGAARCLPGAAIDRASRVGAGRELRPA
jgi:hypothetical protein